MSGESLLVILLVGLIAGWLAGIITTGWGASGHAVAAPQTRLRNSRRLMPLPPPKLIEFGGVTDSLK